MVFGPMHRLGLMGMSRRVLEYGDVYNGLMSVGSLGLCWLLL